MTYSLTFDRQFPDASGSFEAHRSSASLFTALLMVIVFSVGALIGTSQTSQSAQDLTPVAFRALVVERTAEELEAARQAARVQLELQTRHLLGAMSNRAQASFAPWMFEYGQSVRVDLARAKTTSPDPWALTPDRPDALLTQNDVALVQERYGEVVATQKHFLNMLGLLEFEAQKQYRHDVFDRIRHLRQELGIYGLGMTVVSDDWSNAPAAATSRGTRGHASKAAAGSETENRRWADQYFAKLESAVLRGQRATPVALTTGADLPYAKAFLAGIPRLTSRAGGELPEGIASVVSTANEQPALATSAAALVLTWYTANLDSSSEEGVANLSALLDEHFGSLLHHVLRETDNGSVAGLKVHHAELLELSRSA